MSEERSGNVGRETTTGLRNRQLVAMMSIANAMLQASSLDQIVSTITREISGIVDFDRSSMALMSQDGKSLTLRYIHKPGDGEQLGDGRVIPLNEASIIGWVAIHEKAVRRTDIEKSAKFTEVMEEEHLKSDIIIPLLARGKVFGTLNVGSYKRNAFTEEHLTVLKDCGKFASLAIERMLLLLEAQEMSERYSSLQDNSNDIIMIINRNTGKIVDANRKCEAILGYSPVDFTKLSYFDLFAQEDQYSARRDFINILSQKSQSFLDRRMISKEGNFIFVDISANLVKLKNDVFIQMIVHNISQRKMLEQQIIHQNKHLQDVNRRMREVDKMKTEFLANISHELRTPLSIILAYSDSLRGANLSEEEREQFLDVIAENGANLLTLINNLLDLSKLEISGKMLRFTLSHIHDVIKAILPQMEKRAKSKGITISYTSADDVPVIYFDNNQMVQVLTCLIQNAIKFTENDGSVGLKTSYKDREVWISVSDTGVGIPAAQIPHIFDTFHQVDGSTSRETGGLGIGLALARHIVELHKGRLWVESEYGEGSTFTVVLPVTTEEVFLRDESGMVEVRREE